MRRLVYLGGLHPDDEELSPHLASRVEVGRILSRLGVPTAVLQAAVVLGDGSASFDMLRYLTTRLPAMVAPKWLDNRIQPIAVDDVVTLLVGAGDLPAERQPDLRHRRAGGADLPRDDRALRLRDGPRRPARRHGARADAAAREPLGRARHPDRRRGSRSRSSAASSTRSSPRSGPARPRRRARRPHRVRQAVRSAMEGAPDTALRNLALAGAAATASAVVGSSPPSRLAVVPLASTCLTGSRRRRLPGRVDRCSTPTSRGAPRRRSPQSTRPGTRRGRRRPTSAPSVSTSSSTRAGASLFWRWDGPGRRLPSRRCSPRVGRPCPSRRAVNRGLASLVAVRRVVRLRDRALDRDPPPQPLTGSSRRPVL